MPEKDLEFVEQYGEYRVANGSKKGAIIAEVTSILLALSRVCIKDATKGVDYVNPETLEKEHFGLKVSCMRVYDHRPNLLDVYLEPGSQIRDALQVPAHVAIHVHAALHEDDEPYYPRDAGLAEILEVSINRRGVDKVVIAAFLPPYFETELLVSRTLSDLQDSLEQLRSLAVAGVMDVDWKGR